MENVQSLDSSGLATSDLIRQLGAPLCYDSAYLLSNRELLENPTPYTGMADVYNSSGRRVHGTRSRAKRLATTEPLIPTLTSVPTVPITTVENWAQCENCKKWRRLPPNVDTEQLPETWTCTMNIWDEFHNSCAHPEEIVNEAKIIVPPANTSTDDIHIPVVIPPFDRSTAAERLKHYDEEDLEDTGDVISLILGNVPLESQNHPLKDRCVIFSDKTASLLATELPKDVLLLDSTRICREDESMGTMPIAVPVASLTREGTIDQDAQHTEELKHEMLYCHESTGMDDPVVCMSFAYKTPWPLDEVNADEALASKSATCESYHATSKTVERFQKLKSGRITLASLFPQLTLQIPSVDHLQASMETFRMDSNVATLSSVLAPATTLIDDDLSMKHFNKAILDKEEPPPVSSPTKGNISKDIDTFKIMDHNLVLDALNSFALQSGNMEKPVHSAIGLQFLCDYTNRLYAQRQAKLYQEHLAQQQQMMADVPVYEQQSHQVYDFSQTNSLDLNPLLKPLEKLVMPILGSREYGMNTASDSGILSSCTIDDLLAEVDDQDFGESSNGTLQQISEPKAMEYHEMYPALDLTYAPSRMFCSNVQNNNVHYPFQQHNNSILIDSQKRKLQKLKEQYAISSVGESYFKRLRGMQPELDYPAPDFKTFSRRFARVEDKQMSDLCDSSTNSAAPINYADEDEQLDTLSVIGSNDYDDLSRRAYGNQSQDDCKFLSDDLNSIGEIILGLDKEQMQRLQEPIIPLASNVIQGSDITTNCEAYNRLAATAIPPDLYTFSEKLLQDLHLEICDYK